MVDFNKLLEAVRNLTPEERAQQVAQREAEWEARMKAVVAERVAKVEAVCQLEGLGTEERRFIESLQRRAQRTDSKGEGGGELLALSDAQIKWLERLAARAQAPGAPQPPAGTRAYRYGRQQG